MAAKNLTVAVLGNPNAGRGRSGKVTARVLAAIEQRGGRGLAVEPADADDIADALAKALVEHEPDRVVLVGGDGLLHRALPALAGIEAGVGIVPCGTGNDFFRSVGEGRKLDDAIATALDGEPRHLDLLSAKREDGSEELAASVAACGFSTPVTERANGLRFPKGSSRYTVATLLELRRMKPLATTVVADGHTVFDGEATLLAVANTRHFGGGMAVCPEADPDDGLLDVLVVGAVSPWQLAIVLPLVFVGWHLRHPSVSSFRCSSVTIAHDGPWAADGEPFLGQGTGPVTFSARRSVLPLTVNLLGGR